ncbi:MAG: rod shape-determining protein MreD [Burkholderiaceae bacterium]
MSHVVLAREPSAQLFLGSLGTALVLNLLPWPPTWPLPDLLAVCLVFWALQLPGRSLLWPAWLLGLLMDVHQGVLLGEHALAYSLLAYGGVTLHRRLSGFSAWGQAAHLAGLFAIAEGALVLVRWVATSSTPDLHALLLIASNTLTWVVLHRVLLALLSRRPRVRMAKARSRPNAPLR